MYSISGHQRSHFVSQSPPPPYAPPVAVLTQLWDAWPWPLLLLRTDAGLMHANLAARQLLHRGQLLKLDAGRRVQPVAAAQQAEWAAALQAQRPQLLQWPTSAGLMSLTLKPLAAGDDDDSPAIVVMLNAAAARHGDVLAFAQLHGLSPAETRVLDRLSVGLSAAAAAAALGIKPATVRRHVASLRHKSGYASVPLVLRALASMPPLATLHLVQAPRDGAGE